MADFNPTEWITTQEAASLLGYHVKYVRRLVKRGKIVGKKRGGRDWWVDKNSVRAYADEMKRLGTTKHDPTKAWVDNPPSS
jgi:excisionase family DNA binding protein